MQEQAYQPTQQGDPEPPHLTHPSGTRHSCRSRLLRRCVQRPPSRGFRLRAGAFGGELRRTGLLRKRRYGSTELAEVGRYRRSTPETLRTLSFEILGESNLLVWLKCQEAHAKPFTR